MTRLPAESWHVDDVPLFVVVGHCDSGGDVYVEAPIVVFTTPFGWYLTEMGTQRGSV
ncbi:hypothetical protein [Sinomonas atrocyanea]|uniref:hypothetical protein n=1 Tax=Sinomonas atrocyanea TaxID=37927 RepID=UPI002859D9BB|nr:hypothetical protein [Sinomonas atrocyanea]MDR6620782.1 hypothetical protein [Sinomonas atrocyanea]